VPPPLPAQSAPAVLPEVEAASPVSGRDARPHLQAVPDVPLDFDAAVRALTPRLQRYATRRLGDRHEAADLVQEALLRAYQHRDQLRTEDDVAAWTTCVTGRLVIDRLRVRSRSTTVADVPEGARAERDTADVVVARDQARLALDALDAMPPRQAAVLWAREVEGQDYAAIGERFGMTEPAVRSLLTRARKALRKEYATRGGSLPGTGLVLLAPWATSTGWLDRLRGTLDKGQSAAALGVVTAGLVAGAVVLPLLPAAPETTPMPVVTRAGSPEVPPAVQAPAPAPAAAVTVPAAAEPAPAPTQPAPPSAAPAAPAPRAATSPLGATGINDTCVGVAGSGAGGADCAPDPTQPGLRVDVPVDTSPAGVVLPGVETERIDCTRVPETVPFTSCTTPGDQ